VKAKVESCMVRRLDLGWGLEQPRKLWYGCFEVEDEREVGGPNSACGNSRFRAAKTSTTMDTLLY